MRFSLLSLLVALGLIISLAQANPLNVNSKKSSSVPALSSSLSASSPSHIKHHQAQRHHNQRRSALDNLMEELRVNYLMEILARKELADSELLFDSDNSNYNQNNNNDDGELEAINAEAAAVEEELAALQAVANQDQEEDESLGDSVNNMIRKRASRWRNGATRSRIQALHNTRKQHMPSRLGRLRTQWRDNLIEKNKMYQNLHGQTRYNRFYSYF